MDVRTYWRLVAGGAAFGTASFIAVMFLYYSIFMNDLPPLVNLGEALRWGSFLGLMTSVFVIVATLPGARRLERSWGSALFIVTAALGAAAGWLLFGLVSCLFSSWLFYWGFVGLAVVASIGSTLVCALLTFFAESDNDVDDSKPDAHDQLAKLLE